VIGAGAQHLLREWQMRSVSVTEGLFDALGATDAVPGVRWIYQKIRYVYQLCAPEFVSHGRLHGFVWESNWDRPFTSKWCANVG
jgi:hypothetical protein